MAHLECELQNKPFKLLERKFMIIYMFIIEK